MAAAAALGADLEAVAGAEDFFRVLGVDAPTLDDLGHPLWDVDDEELRQQYKKLSLLVHPDKNPEHAELAQAAFEKVNEAFKCLSDPQARTMYIKQYVDHNRPALQKSGWKPEENIVEKLQEQRSVQAKVQQRKQRELEQVQSKMMSSLKNRLKRSSEMAALKRAHESAHDAPKEKKEEEEDVETKTQVDSEHHTNTNSTSGEGNGEAEFIARKAKRHPRKHRAIF